MNPITLVSQPSLIIVPPEKGKKYTRFNLCCPCTYWRRVKLSVASSLETSPSPPYPIRSHTLPLPCHSFSSMASCLDFLGVYGVVSHSQLWFCTHHPHCKRSFLAHNSQRQPGSWTSAWFLETAWTMNIKMGSGSSTDHRPHLTWCPLAARTTDINTASSHSTDYRHGPWWEHRWKSSCVGRFYK